MSMVSSIKLIDLLVCPICKTKLKIEITNFKKKNIVKEGSLECVTCNKVYPIKNGFPVFLKEDEEIF